MGNRIYILSIPKILGQLYSESMQQFHYTNFSLNIPKNIICEGCKIIKADVRTNAHTCQTNNHCSILYYTKTLRTNEDTCIIYYSY